MKHILVLAALAGLPATAFAAAPFMVPRLPENTTPLHLKIEHGQSIQQAIQQARFQARMARLQAQNPLGVSNAVANGRAAPAITAGRVISTTLTVGQASSLPEMQVSFTTGRAGLSGVSLFFTSPNGMESLEVDYYPQNRTSEGTVTFEQPGNVPYYTQPGQWVLTSGFIIDYAYNYTSYTQAQLAALFPQPYLSVVNNGPVDITPPVVTSGKILTPTVSLSSPVPVFKATLTGTDDVSGLYKPFVLIQPPGNSFSFVDEAPMRFPLLAGTGTAYSTILSGEPTGTWTITGYALCDVAGNCFTDQTPADIQTLFGTTTFRVTQ